MRDDLVGQVREQGDWKLVCLPAIAEREENHLIQTPFGSRKVQRVAGEVLHPEREPLDILQDLRETLGEYNFAGQYQQEPAPLGGGLVKLGWFKRYTPGEEPAEFEMIVQSWDTANKVSELADYSVCTTWGVRNKQMFLLDVYREKLEYPKLKRMVHEQAYRWLASSIVVEDKASGTQLIQELIYEGLHQIQRYEPGGGDKILRMNSCTSTIENGSVCLPDNTEWITPYLHELLMFPNSKYDDQVDSTSQAIDWWRRRYFEESTVTISTVRL